MSGAVSMPMPGSHSRQRVIGRRGRLMEDRLWPALSRPPHRPLPPQGMDLLGEWATGCVARMRSLRRLRRRAETVVRQAESLQTLAEAALDERIESARHAALVHRDDPRAVEEAYAVIYEAVRRTVGLSLYPEQVMGALAMADGCCAEMATGEGKTITAVLPAALEAWSGRGVHVHTVNDYLASRDAQLTGPAYRRLGLTVGVVVDSMDTADRRHAYECCVTYGADKQFIFDHLRDRLLSPLRPSLAGHLLDQVLRGTRGVHGRTWGDAVVQRGLHAAIVDEADSVLIDEAVTPAIIAQDVESGAAWGGAEPYRVAAKIAAQLREGEDYIADRRILETVLTDAGRAKLAAMAADLPPFWSGPRRREELILQALGAREFFKNGDDYIIRDGKVVIVDRSTGRVLEGRQWQHGLHQAVEAKEGLEITGAHQASARSSYQRFFQRYQRLCGMTGTAWEVRHELWRDYKLPVVRIPTHRPVIRKRLPDRVFADERAKFEAVADRVAELHRSGRPVLVGTRTVTASEALGAMLAQRGVPCQILNATREAEEAAIVARAGQEGAVTVATNMAGRGTDIILTPETRRLGGLAVIATERHDEARVDRQLFGRAGRQGDPGLAQAFVSLDDALIRRHGLRPLVALVRTLRGPLRRPAAVLLWWSAQLAAGRRAAMMRRETMRHEAWLELSLQSESR
jgi:preprotein translocase subunit SecA